MTLAEVAVVMDVIGIKIETENETVIVTMNHRTRDLETIGRELIPWNRIAPTVEKVVRV